MGYHEHRNVSHIVTETPFVFEGGAEARSLEEFHKARHDAAGDVHAAKSAQIQRQVAAEAPHDHAKQRQRTAAVDTAVGQRPLGNVLWLQFLRQAIVRLDDGAIQIDQARPGQHALGGNVPHFTAQHLQNNVFFFAVRREINMAALARQADPAAIDVHQVGDAQPGAGAVHRDRFARLRIAAAKLQHVVRREHRDRHRDGGEIVDHFQVTQPQAGLHFFDRERPAVIGHRDPVFRHRAGDRDAGVLHPDLALFQVLADHRLQAVELQAGIGFRLGNLTRRNSAQRQAGIGAANITHEGIGH
ncbi:hypothetical protein A4U88_0023 [Serratia marcescens]|nr:hypothetical protein A4U88_0023 [Serratia marcescens]